MIRGLLWCAVIYAVVYAAIAGVFISLTDAGIGLAVAAALVILIDVIDHINGASRTGYRDYRESVWERREHQ